MKYENTFALIKPGAVQRGLIGKIISRFEDKGLNVNAIKIVHVTEEQAKKHYEMHSEKPFFKNLVESLTSSPVVCLVMSGENAIEIVRMMAGSTDPLKSLPGTIRGDYSCDIQNNIIHTSDSKENVVREIGIYFSDSEIIDYNMSLNEWTFSEN